MFDENYPPLQKMKKSYSLARDAFDSLERAQSEFRGSNVAEVASDAMQVILAVEKTFAEVFLEIEEDKSLLQADKEQYVKEVNVYLKNVSGWKKKVEQALK